MPAVNNVITTSFLFTERHSIFSHNPFLLSKIHNTFALTLSSSISAFTESAYFFCAEERVELSTPGQVWKSLHICINPYKAGIGRECESGRHMEGVYLTLCLRRFEIWQTFGIKVLNLATVDAPGVIISRPAVYPASPNCIPVRAQRFPI